MSWYPQNVLIPPFCILLPNLIIYNQVDQHKIFKSHVLKIANLPLMYYLIYFNKFSNQVPSQNISELVLLFFMSSLAIYCYCFVIVIILKIFSGFDCHTDKLGSLSRQLYSFRVNDCVSTIPTLWSPGALEWVWVPCKVAQAHSEVWTENHPILIETS